MSTTETRTSSSAPRSRPTVLSHDPLCLACGHGTHRYLPCSATCDCEPPSVPWATWPDVPVTASYPLDGRAAQR